MFLPVSSAGNLLDSTSYQNQTVSKDIKSTVYSCFAEQKLALSFTSYVLVHLLVPTAYLKKSYCTYYYY